MILLTISGDAAKKLTLGFAVCLALILSPSCQPRESRPMDQAKVGDAADGESLPPGPPPGKGGPPPEGEVRGAGRGEAEHPEEIHLAPPKARLLWVSAGADGGGDGSEKRPWNDLQTALRQLRSGDRLVLLPGNYQGPYVIDQSCAEAPAGNPIELHSKVDAVLRGNGQAPALSVRRNGWKLIGTEIVPGRRGTAPALEVAGARDLVISRGHFHDGWGDGVWIEPGSERITIANTHIHIFGPRGGAPSGRKEVIGLRVAPGTRDIKVVESNIHNISGPPVKVLTPAEYGRPALPAATGFKVEETTQLANWPEKGE